MEDSSKRWWQQKILNQNDDQNFLMNYQWQNSRFKYFSNVIECIMTIDSKWQNPLKYFKFKFKRRHKYSQSEAKI